MMPTLGLLLAAPRACPQLVHYVVYLDASASAETLAAFDAILADATELRDRSQLGGAAAGSAIVAAPAHPSSTAVAAPRPSSSGGGSKLTEVAEAVSVGVLVAGRLTGRALVTGADVAGRGFRW
jgi:hypothetical protein